MSQEDTIQWRQDEVRRLLSRGHYSHRQIASILQVSRKTISRDVQYIKQEAKESLRKLIDEKLPYEYEQVMISISEVLQQCWNIVDNTTDPHDKIHALALIKEVSAMKLDLLNDATVATDALKFVDEKKQELGLERVGNINDKVTNASTNVHMPTTDDNNNDPDNDAPTYNQVF